MVWQICMFHGMATCRLVAVALLMGRVSRWWQGHSSILPEAIGWLGLVQMQFRVGDCGWLLGDCP
jgi:hypothetical protein